jgi:hypothetical protein
MRNLGAVLAALVALTVGFAACAPPPTVHHLDYDRLGIHSAVVIGGQAQIDEGLVVQVPWLEPRIWLAAHANAAGGPFHALLAARAGDRVCVDQRCYQVTFTAAVPAVGGVTRVLGPLVLQTSLPDNRRLLVSCN